LAALVSKLQAIPELVLELDGDPDAIIGYYDRACAMRLPDGSAPANLRGAIIAMPKPGILIIWEGTGPNGNRGLVWSHRFRLFLRAKPEYSGDTPRGYAALFSLIINGIPQGGDGQKLINTRVHPACDEMDIPSAQRAQLVIDEAGNTLDFFEVSLAFPEVGDN
jgi:hypothetical protein